MTDQPERLPAADPPPSLPAGDASLLALVDRLAALLERSELLEIEVEAGGTGLILRKAAALAAPRGGPATETGEPLDVPATAPGADADGTSTPSRGVIPAPLTGIFYGSPSPGSPPFVEVGSEVVAGQVIGLIEAMKLFNEIKSDRAGRVVRVIAESGTLVKARSPLVEVEPL